MRASAFIDSYFNAWNHRDPKGVADHLSADGLYRDVPENQQRTPDELIVSLSGFFSRFRHRYELIGNILYQGDTLAFQYRMTPEGKSRKNGSKVTYHGAEFMTIAGNSATGITDYYDVPMEMLGHKYSKSGLTPEQLTNYKRRLENIMQSQRVFLRSDLTLPKLAEEVDCSVNHLSQVINAGFGTSFFGYLNRHRIEHAKTLLTELDSQGNAILNVAFTVGFNSNSAFYVAFKKHVGQTPAQYRRKHLIKTH